jgi:hypothetical protein
LDENVLFTQWNFHYHPRMAAELPYLPTYKNLGLLFEKISTAKQPDAFSQTFLNETLLLKSKGDRALIPLLRTLGFLDSANKPTAEYALLKNKTLARKAIARGIQKAYAPLYAANEKAHDLQMPDLKGLIGQVAGVDEAMTGRIAGTFNALVKSADFTGGSVVTKDVNGEKEEEQEDDEIDFEAAAKSGKGLRPEFHYNFQIHLPPNGSQETYLNIFNALQKVFKQ